MTKEELEKEAEEYLIRNLCKTCLTICENNCPHAESEKRAFKDGAEFGYNKANEWHDLRKDPEDLPKEEKDYLIYSGEEWRMCVGRYSPKYKAWEAGCDTIAWMEIPEPPKNGGSFF